MPERVKEEAPQITQASLRAATWALFGVSVVFYCARIAVRLMVSRRLYWDDAWATLSLVLLLGLSVSVTLAIPTMYEVLNVGAGLELPTLTFMPDASKYLKLQFAMTLLFWSCIWSVKACFLAFYRRLTNGLKWCRWAWWATVVITTLSYIGSVITYPVSCSSFVIGDCEAPINLYRSLVSLRFSTCVDIITDGLIIALPLYLALRVRLPMTQKLALGAVFSLGVVIMIFAVIRIVVTEQANAHPETSWLNLWSQIEASVAVIISSLAPFKSFFTSRRNKTYPSGEAAQKPSNGPRKALYGREHSYPPPASIPLDERSRQHAVHHHGTIGVAKGGDEYDSRERILRESDMERKDIL